MPRQDNKQNGEEMHIKSNNSGNRLFGNYKMAKYICVSVSFTALYTLLTSRASCHNRQNLFTSALKP